MLARVGGGYGPDFYASASLDITHPAIINIFHYDPAKRSKGKRDNPAMQTVECLAARSSLRAHPGLIDSIRRLATLYRLDDEHLVTREAYFEMHLVRRSSA